MKDFLGFTRRNLIIYFKDILAIFFSLLTSIIVFVLYLLFLKGTFVDALEATMNGLENFVSGGDVDMLANGILLTGILGTAMITVPYTCLQTIVKDRESGVDSDICATPLKRWKIILSYFTASTLCSFIMTSLILTVGLVVIGSMGDLHLSIGSYIAAYGMMFLGSVSSTALFMLSRTPENAACICENSLPAADESSLISFTVSAGTEPALRRSLAAASSLSMSCF